MKARHLLTVVAWAAMSFFTTAASAFSYNFYNITTNAGNPDLSGQLSLDVTQSESQALVNQVLFTVSNNGPVTSVITRIYFDFGTTNLFSVPDGIGFSASDSGGPVGYKVDYYNVDTSTDPNQLPGGNAISPQFVAEDAAYPDNPQPKWGVGVGEYAGFLGTFASGDLTALVSALDSGNFRVGLHLQGFENGGSDSYVTTPNPVPLPAAAWLFGSALIGFVTLSNRRRV